MFKTSVKSASNYVKLSRIAAFKFSFFNNLYVLYFYFIIFIHFYICRYAKVEEVYIVMRGKS